MAALKRGISPVGHNTMDTKIQISLLQVLVMLLVQWRIRVLIPQNLVKLKLTVEMVEKEAKAALLCIP